MKLQILSTALLTLLTAVSPCKDASVAEIRGKHFYKQSTGDYIPIKGIVYNPRPNKDSQTASHATEQLWQRDIEHFKALNVNLVHLTRVDPSLSHEAFFCALEQAGIYAIVSLTDKDYSDEAAPFCHLPDLKAHGETIVSLFQKYANVIAFDATNKADPACQKKFLRDMRAFVSGCRANGMRQIPIGLSVADLEESAVYYSCQSNDPLESAEWVGLQQNSECEQGGYEALYQDLVALKLPVPVVLTDMGCIHSGLPTIDGYQAQRQFDHVKTLFGQDMLNEVAGGVVYEYSTDLARSASPWPFETMGEGNFGVVYMAPEDCDDLVTPCEVVRFPQFQYLADEYAAVNSIVPPVWDGRPETIECPADYESLDSYDWVVDNIASMSCPTVTTFDCPSSPDCLVDEAAVERELADVEDRQNTYTITFTTNNGKTTNTTTFGANPNNEKNTTNKIIIIIPKKPSTIKNIVNKTTITPTRPPTKKPTRRPTKKPTRAPTKRTPAPTAKVTATATTRPAQCSAYPVCQKLIGNCCPTQDGIFLYCCEGK
jgi:1,3-beta-glucanosyltransferase GAS5